MARRLRDRIIGRRFVLYSPQHDAYCSDTPGLSNWTDTPASAKHLSLDTAKILKTMFEGLYFFDVEIRKD